MQVSADVPLHLLPSHIEWRKLMAKTTVPESARSIRGVPCRVWRGGNQLRYHGKRWIPRRLFYVLGVDGGHARMTKAKIVTMCGRPNCIEARHLQAAPHEPPSQTTYAKKRLELDSDDDDDTTVRAPKRVRGESAADTVYESCDDDEDYVEDEEADAQIEEIMRELYEKLARIDAEEREKTKNEESSAEIPLNFQSSDGLSEIYRFLL